MGSEYLSIIHLDLKPLFFSIGGGLLSQTVAWHFSPKYIIAIIKHYHDVPFNRRCFNKTHFILSYDDLPQYYLPAIICPSVAYKTKQHYEECFVPYIGMAR